jgi:uncharacterized protein (DUF2147 family)
MPRLLLLIAIGALGGAAAPSQPSVQGSWLTEDGKGVVTIAPCGNAMCGRTTKILAAGPKVPKTDISNPDPKLRGRPILGMMVLTGFTRNGAVWKNGRAYDPQSGKSYRASLALNPDGSLKVTGCVLIICQSKRWTRAR